jgi:membrane protein required for colicin V production
MTYLDIGLIVVMVLSGLFAMARGFVREVLSIGSWLLAALVAVWLHPRFMPLVADKITNDFVAKIVVIGVIFILVLVVVSLITGRISDMVSNSAVGFIDRGLGFLFGLARGFAIVALAFWGFNTLVPADKGGSPDFIKNAKSLSALQGATDKMQSLLPSNPFETMKQQIDKNIGTTPPKQGG